MSLVKKSIKIIIALSISVLVGTVLYNVNGDPELNGKVSVEDACAYAISNNQELKFYETKINTVEKRYNDKMKALEDAKGFEEDMKKEIYPKQHALDIDTLKNEQFEAKEKLIRDTEKCFYNIKIQNDLISAQEYKISRLQKELDNKKNKIDVGTEASYTVVNEETALKQAEMELEQYKTQEKSLRMQLNAFMGLNVDKELDLDFKDIPYEEYKVDNIDKVIDNMLEKDFSIEKLITQEAIYINEKDIVDSYDIGDDSSSSSMVFGTSGSNSINYGDKSYELEDEIQKLHYDIKDAQVNLQVKVRSDYNNLLNLRNTVEMKKLDYERALALKDAEKAKFDVGLIDEVELMKSYENVKFAYCDYEKAVLDYYSAVSEFKNYIRKGK